MGESNGRLPRQGDARADADSSEGIALTIAPTKTHLRAGQDGAQGKPLIPYDENLAKRTPSALRGHSYSEKRMFGGLAFLVSGHMCCGIVGEDLVIRTGAEAQAEALAQPHARPMDFTGRPMRGFVYVGPSGYRSPAQLDAWLQRGLRFVLSLAPK